MKKFTHTLEKFEYEIPFFLILAVKLPFPQMKTYGISFLILSAAAAVLLGRVIRRADKGLKLFYLFFVALMLSGDMMKEIFMPETVSLSILSGKTASFLCFLLSVLIIRAPVPLFSAPGLRWSVPFICAAGIIAGPSFAVFFVPVILILLVYENYSAGKSGFDGVFIATCLVTLLISAAFIAIGLQSGTRYMGFVPFGFVFKILDRAEMFKGLAAALPFILVFAALWAGAYKSAPEKKLKRILVFCVAEPIFAVFINIFFYYAVSDGWKYYIFMAFFTQFCLLFYFWDKHGNAVAGSAEKLGLLFKKRPYLPFIAMIYLIKAAEILYPR